LLSMRSTLIGLRCKTGAPIDEIREVLRGLAVGRLNTVLLRLERLARSCSHVLALLGGHGLPQAGDDGGVSGRERVMDCCHVYVLPK
jgi:hypothetical protein